MDLYVIRRRSNWKDASELETTAEKSSAEGEKMSDEVRWIRSYVVEEEDGRLGTVCIYQGVSPEAIRRHAENTGMSADEIVKVADTVIVRDDPVTATA
ncbi:MAG TPA: nickel-binding protein [Solirubrobacterales bacterium]